MRRPARPRRQSSCRCTQAPRRRPNPAPCVCASATRRVSPLTTRNERAPRVCMRCGLPRAAGARLVCVFRKRQAWVENFVDDVHQLVLRGARLLLGGRLRGLHLRARRVARLLRGLGLHGEVALNCLDRGMNSYGFLSLSLFTQPPRVPGRAPSSPYVLVPSFFVALYSRRSVPFANAGGPR